MIHDHQGKVYVDRRFNVLAVVDVPLLFRNNLEQCADFCMRLWADYLNDEGRLDQLSLFHYSGEPRHLEGGRRKLREFLQGVFAEANSASLKRGCRPVAPSDLRPGDMFVQNLHGGVGHVSMIVDTCTNVHGDALYLVGFSFMPAQEFHIERASDDDGSAGWFSLDGYRRYLAKSFPAVKSGEPVLRRFRSPVASPASEREE